MGKFGHCGEAIDATTELLEDPVVAQPVERARMDAQREDILGAQDAAVPPERLDGALVCVRSHRG
jgi:hypothetical protein